MQTSAFPLARPQTGLLLPCLFSWPTFLASHFLMFSTCSHWKCPWVLCHLRVGISLHLVWPALLGWCFCCLPKAGVLFWWSLHCA